MTFTPRRKHIALCTAISAVLTAGIVAWDTSRTASHQINEGLRWARQVASQAEGLAFKAREAGEKDPVGWAASYLAQGQEPRTIRITRIDARDSADSQGFSSGTPEAYGLERSEGVFDYAKILIPENGIGVRINLSLGYSGFFGAKSHLAADLLAAAVFGLLFGIAFLRTGRYFGFDDTRGLRLLITRWVAGAKAQLTQHGVHIREMVRQSQRLAVASGKSREQVGELRGKIHSGLSELHASRKMFDEFQAAAARAEALALSAAIEANRIGGEARRVADMTGEIHRLIGAMRTATLKCQALIAGMEKRIEPWATDADVAYHAFDEVREATETLGKHIRSTTETLLGQAKLIQSLNLELGESGTGTGAAQPAATAPAIAPALAQVVPSAAFPAPMPALEATPVASTAMTKLPEPLPPVDERANTASLVARLKRKKTA